MHNEHFLEHNSTMEKTIRQIAAPAAELLTLAEVWAHLKIDLDATGSPPSHPDDALLTALIAVAREAAENFTGLTISSRQFELALDAFPSSTASLQTTPVAAIDTVTYTDTDGDSQTLSAAVYFLDDRADPAEIVLGWEQQWPSTRAVPNAVKVRFAAGCTDGQSPNPYPCPLAIKQAMLLTIGHLYENRQSVVGTQRYELPMGVTSLLMPYRINLGM